MGDLINWPSDSQANTTPFLPHSLLSNVCIYTEHKERTVEKWHPKVSHADAGGDKAEMSDGVLVDSVTLLLSILP